MALVNCTEPELYLVCETGWTSCREHLAQFTLASPLYDNAFIDARLAEVVAANNLPDEATRYATAELAHIQLEKDGRTCCDNWQMLKRYIAKAYPEDQHKVLFNEAGINFYEKAVNQNWESVTQINTRGAAFITLHSVALLANQNMPSTFAANIFNPGVTAFTAQLQTFYQAEEAARVGTAAKNAANEAIHTAVMSMFLDGQQIFRNNPTVKEQFIFESVLALISGAGSAGFKGLILDSVTSQPVPNVKVGLFNTNKVTTTGPDGRYRLNAASGFYTILIECPGYQPQTLTDREVKVGAHTIININLVPAP